MQPIVIMYNLPILAGKYYLLQASLYGHLGLRLKFHLMLPIRYSIEMGHGINVNFFKEVCRLRHRIL